MAYHHGDLRSALLDAAIELIAERGLTGLSLRECARRAGVSHGAPARHFPDKNALVLAIAQQGFEQLAAAGVAAMQEVADPIERLDAYGVAYVRFAVEQPVLFRVMFSGQFELPAPDGVDAGSFELLVAAARAIVGEDDELLGAIASWSLPHGLAMLLLDGRIPADQGGTADQAEALARAVFAQWRGPLARKPRKRARSGG